MVGKCGVSVGKCEKECATVTLEVRRSFRDIKTKCDRLKKEPKKIRVAIILEWTGHHTTMSISKEHTKCGCGCQLDRADCELDGLHRFKIWRIATTSNTTRAFLSSKATQFRVNHFNFKVQE